MFYYDPTYILVLIGVIICALASARVNAVFDRYSRVRNHQALTGREAAEQILHASGIYDVTVQRISGKLTDHYDPRNKVLRLSDSTYSSTSVAAIGVAAHECGHAIQHQNAYLPLKIRGALVPIVNFGSTISWPLILVGLFLNGRSAVFLINLGILLFSTALVFQIVTLPVEFNASRRAVGILQNTGMLQNDEVRGVRKVLKAAALTYVAGAVSTILQFLRLLLITSSRRDGE